MESGDFHREFHAACFLGDMPKIHEAIATALTVEELNAGLKSATRGCHIDAVAALFNAGAHISAESTGALRGEYGNQDPRVVRLFLDKGLDPNATNSKGEPILPSFSNPEAAAELLSAGADPNRLGPRGVPPLGYRIVSTREPSTAMLELYISHGAKLESNLLWYAVRPRVPQSELMTRFLLDRGADPNVTGEKWGTPLHLAARIGRVEVVRILLEAGADPTALFVGKRVSSTPAQMVEQLGDVERREAILGLLREYSERRESREIS